MVTITWETLEKHIKILNPSIINMGGSRGVRIGFNPNTHSLFLRMPINSGEQLPPIPYSELSAEIVTDETGLVLELSTTNDNLFPEFHKFAEIITEDFEKPDQTAIGALTIAIQKLKNLTSLKSILTKDQQLGLHGELLFLQSLLHVQGPSAVSAWTGRDKNIPDRHDFRFNNIDLEVKTTKSTERIHVIHGLEQLQPSLDHSLYLFSIRLENAGLGVGKGLVALVNDIRSHLSKSGFEKQEFEVKLSSTGYFDDDASYYVDELILADSPMVILINDLSPRITREILSSSLSLGVLGRISDVSYRVNFEGLGFKQESDDYKKIFGEIRL